MSTETEEDRYNESVGVLAIRAILEKACEAKKVIKVAPLSPRLGDYYAADEKLVIFIGTYLDRTRHEYWELLVCTKVRDRLWESDYASHERVVGILKQWGAW